MREDTLGLIDRLLPVVALVLGWFLNEVSQHQRLRRESRAAMGRALAELLEVRHSILVVQEVAAQLRNQLQLPDGLGGELVRALEQVVPLADAGGRYDEAVTAIASVDPLLGYRLRSKNLIPTYLRKVRSLAEVDVVDPAVFTEFDRLLTRELLSTLADDILHVARRYGLVTRYHTWRLLRRKGEPLPADFQRLLQRLREEPGAAT